MSAAQNHLDVDPENVNWQSFSSYTGFRYHLLNVDVENRVIDLMFQFDANEKCFYHAHHQPSSTLVLQGEQHIWEKDEKGKETHKVRRAGEFGISNQKEVHIEGGGPDGGVIYQNIRCGVDPVYSILNADLSTRIDVSLEDFAKALDEQNN